MTTHNDGYAYSAVPISNVNANAFLSQNNSITIGSGALLKTAQEVYITAQPNAHREHGFVCGRDQLGERPWPMAS